MCLICVDLAKAKMTAREARAQLRELRDSLPRDHVAEVEASIARAERGDAGS